MSLAVERLELRHWRSFEEKDIDFSFGLTVLVGDNAVGKTNTIEALQLLTAGLSFRRPRPIQLIHEGDQSARAAARLVGDGRLIDVACEVSDAKRTFYHNEKRCKAADMPRTLMSVLFNPDDLSFVKRSASYRRDELDDFGRQASGSYGNLLAAYQRAVEQRNRLLKEDFPDRSLLEAWDASVAVGGAALAQARLNLFARLKTKVEQIYADISGGEELRATYVSTLGDIEGKSRDEMASLFFSCLEASRETDLRRQMTTVGPHRDDVVFEIGGRDGRVFGSQGQQRSVVLSWKMAEVEVAHDVLGEQPLLLLDDVMSELDARRRDSMTRFVQSGIQTVITTTNLGYFPDDLLKDAKVVRLGGRG